MKDIYKWDAEAYHKSSADQQKWARELILKLKLKGDERVLDIGCGYGKVTAEVAKLLPSSSIKRFLKRYIKFFIFTQGFL